MAADIFAKLGDIKGESLDSKHKDEVEVLSWSWGVSQTGHARHGRRRRRGQGELQRLLVHAPHRQGVAESPESVRHRRAHQGSDDHGTQGRQGPAGILIIKMNDVIVTSVVLSSSADTSATAESVALRFAKVDVEYKPQKPDGSLDAGVSFKYDIKANKVG
jgi:type VI secretion system secreted protein Hcp